MSTVSSGLGDMLRRIFGGSPQRVVRERVGKTPFPETAPIQQAPPAEAKAAYRVGFNPKQKGRIDPTTGERFLTGSFPTPAGIAAALARVLSLIMIICQEKGGCDHENLPPQMQICAAMEPSQGGGPWHDGGLGCQISKLSWSPGKPGKPGKV